MGFIIKSCDVIGGRGRAEVQALFDTGSGASFVRQDIAEQIGNVVEVPGGPEQFTMADEMFSLSAYKEVALRVTIGNVRPLRFNFLVVGTLAEEMIIGVDMMQRWKIKIDPEQEDVSVDPRALYMRA